VTLHIYYKDKPLRPYRTYFLISYFPTIFNLFYLENISSLYSTLVILTTTSPFYLLKYGK